MIMPHWMPWKNTKDRTNFSVQRRNQILMLNKNKYEYFSFDRWAWSTSQNFNIHHLAKWTQFLSPLFFLLCSFVQNRNSLKKKKTKKDMRTIHVSLWTFWTSLHLIFICLFVLSHFFSFTIFLRTSTSSASLVLLFFIWTFLLIDSIFFILSFENNPLEHHQTISKGPYRRSVPRLFLIRVACVIIYAFVACLSLYIFPSFSFSLFLFFSFRLHKRKENYSTFNICLCILTEQ